MRFIAAAFLVAVLASYANGTSFRTCRDGNFLLKRPSFLEVVNCSTPPCIFHHRQNATGFVDFTLSEATNTLKHRVHAHVAGSVTEFYMPELDACSSLVIGSCPIAAYTPVKYKISMPVLSSYPLILLSIQVSLIDDRNATVMCFNLPSIIEA